MSRSDPSPRRPGRPRGSDTARMRQQIIEAATELIGRQGFGATSMTQVAQAAGISPTGLNHHFGSRTGLLAAVLEHRDTQDSHLADDCGRPWDTVDLLVAVARRNMRRPELVRLFATLTGEATTPEHPAHAWAQQHYDGVLTLIRASIQRDKDSGIIRDDAPVDRLARQIVALMDGYQTQWLLDPSIDMAQLLADHVAELKARWVAD